ncbi:MAG: chromate transporter [Clostridiaceae bacterium]|jgi:chromate transporter|nr:chromate transporter [Clostridiaceae bacterium]
MMQVLKLFITFFKVGAFSFGGGYAMLPLIYKEIEEFGLTMTEFTDVVAISQMTPGPIAVNAATYMGYKSAGFWGSAFATFGVALPSFILIMIIVSVFDKFKSSRIVNGALEGIRPATVGMISSSVIFFSKTSLIDLTKLSEGFWRIFSIQSVLIFVLTIIGSKKLKLGPVVLTLAGGVLGAILL